MSWFPVTLRMRVVGVASTASTTSAVMVTGTIRPFGVAMLFGVAVTARIVGAVVSRTVTVNVPVVVAPLLSVAVAVTVVVPMGNVLPEAWLSVTGSGPSSGSVAVTVNVTAAPAALVA